MRRVAMAGISVFALSMVVLASAADAATRPRGSSVVGLSSRSLPASPVTIDIDKSWAKSNCGFAAAGGTSASGSCSTNSSVKSSTSAVTTPTSSTIKVSQTNSAGSSTTASATGPGSVAAGGGSSSAGTLSARLRIR